MRMNIEQTPEYFIKCWSRGRQFSPEFKAGFIDGARTGLELDHEGNPHDLKTAQHDAYDAGSSAGYRHIQQRGGVRGVRNMLLSSNEWDAA